MQKTILKVRKYKAGYEVRTELIDGAEYGCPDIEIKSAYTNNGDYIGDPKTAYFLYKKKDIKPEKAKPSHNTCSIGFCTKDQSWFGWSHRAIASFKIGDKVKTDDSLAEYLPVGFEAATLDDCKMMAKYFAESVS